MAFTPIANVQDKDVHLEPNKSSFSTLDYFRDDDTRTRQNPAIDKFAAHKVRAEMCHSLPSGRDACGCRSDPFQVLNRHVFV